MVAEQCHWPPMFRHIPSVYSSVPDHPGGLTSGHRPGPSFFENSTSTPCGRISTVCSAVVIDQLARSVGELWSTAPDRFIMSDAWAGPGLGVGVGVGDGDPPPPGVRNDRIWDHAPWFFESTARTRQNSV